MTRTEYIEREAAIAVIEEKQKELCPVGMYSRHAVYGSDREKFDAWQEIIDALEAIPAADVRPVVHTKTENALDMVRAERDRQNSLWGDQSNNHPFEWISILGEEYGELCEAVNETCFQNGTHPERGGRDKIIKEATHIAAVAVEIIEANCGADMREGS